MANLQGFYDVNDAPGSGDFDALPDGEYVAVIEASEWKDTKAGNGKYLALTLQIIEGDCKGRKVWDNLNLENPNEKAVQIARGTLAAIRHATGVLEPKDSSALHDIPLVVKLGSEEYNGNRKNVVKSYKARARAEAKPAAQRAKPWQRGG